MPRGVMKTSMKGKILRAIHHREIDTEENNPEDFAEALMMEIETTLSALSPAPRNGPVLRLKKTSKPTVSAFLEHPLDRTDTPYPKG